MPIIIPGLILVFLLIVLAFVMVLKAETNEKNSVFGGLEMVLFLVMMPKNPVKKEGESQKEEKTDETKIKLIEANKTIENLTQENKDLKKQLEEKKQKISTTSVLAGLVNSLRNDLKKTDKDVGLALRTLKMFDCEKGGEKI